MLLVNFVGEQEEDLRGTGAAVPVCLAFEAFLGEVSNAVPCFGFGFLAMGTSRSESKSSAGNMGQNLTVFKHIESHHSDYASSIQ